MIAKEYIYQTIPSWLLQSETYYIVVTDLRGVYEYVNPFFERVFGFVCSNFENAPIHLSIHPEDIEACTQAAVKSLENIGQIIPVQIRKPDSLGGYYWTHWEFSAFLDEHKQPVGVLCIGHDITTSQRATQKLKESEAKFKAILDSTTNSNFLVNPDYKVVSFNKVAARSILRLHQKHLKEGDSIWEYITEGYEEEFNIYFQKALYGEITTVEQQIYSKIGVSTWFEITYFPAYDQDGKLIGVAINSFDIDARKKAEAQVKFQNEQLKEIARLQSHAVRRPVASILGLMKIIDKANLSTDNQHYMILLEQVTQELDEVIRKIVSKANELEADMES